MEAKLLLEKGVRRPKSAGPELPFVLFVTLLIGANFGAFTPLWFSQAVIPVTFFVISWMSCLKTRDDFDQRLDEMTDGNC